MGTLWQDTKYAVRALRRSPGFTTIAVATLALGIGANTAIFSVIDAVIMRPLPFEQPENLLVVREYMTRDAITEDASAGDFLDWREQTTAFEHLAAWRLWGMVLTGLGEPEDLGVVRASPSLFDVLKQRPVLGRGFTESDEVYGRHRVVLLTHGFWTSRWGGDPTVLGRTMSLDNEPYEIVGVLPASFAFPAGSDAAVYVPLGFSADEVAERERRMFNVVGRLAPGATAELASQELERVAAGVAERFPATNQFWTTRVTPAAEALIGNQRHLLILMAAVGCLLFIACANVANLLLARGTARRREIAVRSALGAARSRLLRQVMLESMVIALSGGVLGVLLGGVALNLLLAAYPGILPAWNTPGLDGRVLLAALLFSLVSALIAGFAPARQALSWNLSDSLKDGEAGGRRPARTRALLVVSEIAVSYVLVVSAGLLIHSLQRLTAVDPGFNSANLLVSTLSLPEARYPEDARQRQFFEDVLTRVRGLPGVAAAGVTTTLPMNPLGIDHDMPVSRADEPVPAGSATPQADFRMISAGYFDLMGIPVRQGREFSSTDRADGVRVAVVNETFARQFFGTLDPLNRVILVGGPGGEATIVGVVGDVRHRALDQSPRPEVFVAFPQWYSYANMTLVVRAAGPAMDLAGPVTAAVHALDPDQPLSTLLTMEKLVGDSSVARRFNLLLFGCFAALGLTLAVTGVYGLVSFNVGRRTREIGIRIALGARAPRIVSQVVTDGLRLTLAGLILGIAFGFVGTQVLRSQLFEVSPTDPVTFLVVALFLLGAGMLAAYLPALRAARVHPMVALRDE